MLKIVHSRHGQGKTSYLIGDLRETLLQGCEVKPLFVVPEQFHFETERKLYYALGRENIKNAEITSFTKLSGKIVSKYGEGKPYCDDMVKLVTMMKSIHEAKASFVHYGRRSAGSGFAPEMLSLLDGFKREGILPCDLESENTTVLHKKLADIKTLYTKYDELLNINYADKLDDTLRAAKLAQGLEMFTGRRIYFDGFDGFSGSQREMIKAMLMSGKEVTISLPLDSYPSNEREYRAINNVVKQLTELCRQTGKSHAFIPVESFPPRAAEKKELVSAPDIYAECDYIGAKISSLVHDHDYTFNDIAVLCADKDIMPILVSALNKYEISAFADIPSPILEKPLIRFILQTLEATMFTGDSVITYIKSGFVRVRAQLERTAILERRRRLTYKRFKKTETYAFFDRKNSTARLGRRSMNEFDRIALLYNIKGRDWKKSFPQTEECIALEPLRSELVGQLENLAKKIENTTGDKITEALSEFLINDLQLGKTILAIVNRRNAEFKKGFQIDKSLSDEYRQLWELMVTVFESMYSALHDYPVSVRDYTEMLRRLLAQTNIAKPPQVLDAVTVGDIERTRTDKIKVAFIAGAQSGTFPKSAAQNGVFTSNELEELIGIGIEMADKRMVRYYKEQFAAYKAISVPSDLLVLTAARYTPSWEPAELSPFFDALSKKYDIKTQNTELMSKSFFVRNLNTLKQYAARNPNDMALQKALFEYDPVYANRISQRYGARHTISSELAKELLDGRTESPTSLKALASCPFSYFCRYGLAVYPLDTENTDEPSAILKGSLVHYCIEQATEDFAGFMGLSHDALKLRTADLIKQFIDNLPYREYTKAQTEYLFSIQETDIAKMLIQLQQEFKDSEFVIKNAEKSFTYDLSGVKIKGRIDRIDMLDSEQGKFVRIVDYKSGKDRFDWNNVYYGLDLQILLYLFASDKDGEPSGAYIKNTSGGLSAKAVYSETLVPTKDEALRNWLENRRMSGIQLKGSEGGADIKRLAALYQKSAYPAGRKGNKAEFVSARELTPEEYEKLKQYLADLISSKKQDIVSGNIEAVPLQKQKDKEKEPCGYCAYRDICHNDDEFVKIEPGMTDKMIES